MIRPAPHAGMLLKVMRRRRGASSAALAAVLGTSPATLHRWERLDLRPAEEQIRLACAALRAHPEELAALLVLPWKLPARPPEPLPLPPLCHRVGVFLRDSRGGGNPLTDLEALSLQSALWPHAARSEEGQRLLAAVNADYGYWLGLQRRNPEAAKFAYAVLEMAEPLGGLEGESIIALDVLATVQSGEPAHGSGKAFRLCERWLDAFADSEQRAFLLCLMAEYASRAARHHTALSLISEVDRLWATESRLCASDRDGLDRSRRLQRARILKRTGRVAEALTLLPSPSTGTTAQRAFASHLWADALLEAGEKGDAAVHLGQLQDAISAHGLRLWQSNADDLGRRL